MKTQLITLEPRWSSRSLPFHIRGEGSDTDVLAEVVERRCYRRPTIGVEILESEHWLDLGANIGAFAACCYLHGATASCYEPEPECFKLLKKNVGKLKGFHIHNTAVSTSKSKQLESVKSDNPENHYRLTIVREAAPSRYVPGGSIPNLHVSNVATPPVKTLLLWDGVKLDIEGAELSMIDEGCLPATEKLVMEYHFSRSTGDVMKAFHARMDILRDLYKVVKYPPSLDKTKKGRYPGRFDLNVFCKGLR